MAFTNNVMIVRHKLLAMMVNKWKQDKLCTDIDRLPIELSPRRSEVLGRCCVHKERAVWKYKMFPLLGYDMNDEKDELTPLSDYARRVVNREREQKDNIMCVIDEACSSCVKTNYEITNLCRGCVARSCSMNCPKHAITHDKKNHGQAVIDHDLCINCGKCVKACPVQNITLKDGKFRFGGHCLGCTACSFNCPTNAINIGMLNGWKVNGAYNFGASIDGLTEKDVCRYCHKSYIRYFEKHGIILGKDKK